MNETVVCQIVPEEPILKLIGISEEVRGVEWPLRPGRLTFGRTPENDLNLDHPTISRRHGIIESENSGIVLYDLASRNGIRRNGKKEPVLKIRLHEIVQVGGIEVKLVKIRGERSSSKARGLLLFPLLLLLPLLMQPERPAIANLKQVVVQRADNFSGVRIENAFPKTFPKKTIEQLRLEQK